MERSAIAGLVLMGGQASRMGGGDKGLIEIGGRSVLARLLERFAPQVGPLALSANGDPARFARYRLPVIGDAGPLAGPLAGVLAGLAWAAAQPGVTHLATVPGDAPTPPRDLVARLTEAGEDRPAAARGGRGIEPLHALWPLSVGPRLETLIAEGVASPRRSLELLGAAQVLFDDPDAFLDLDTAEDVALARSKL